MPPSTANDEFKSGELVLVATWTKRRDWGRIVRRVRDIEIYSLTCPDARFYWVRVGGREDVYLAEELVRSCSQELTNAHAKSAKTV